MITSKEYAMSDKKTLENKNPIAAPLVLSINTKELTLLCDDLSAEEAKPDLLNFIAIKIIIGIRNIIDKLTGNILIGRSP